MIFLGVGSSIGEAEKVFKQAATCLIKAGVRVVSKSKVMKNAPYGGVAQNEFSNAVWQVEFGGRALELLAILKECEAIAGRDLDGTRWADRELDLDILMFHDQILQTDDLQIPHPEIPKRSFVLQPWSEIVDKNFEITKFGSISKLLSDVRN